jgi:hypothetical protein
MKQLPVQLFLSTYFESSSDQCIASMKRYPRKADASLRCYDCSGHNPNCGVSESTLEGGCKACMVYLNVNDGSESIHPSTDLAEQASVSSHSIQTMSFEDVVNRTVVHQAPSHRTKVGRRSSVQRVNVMESVPKRR